MQRYVYLLIVKTKPHWEYPLRTDIEQLLDRIDSSHQIRSSDPYNGMKSITMFTDKLNDLIEKLLSIKK